MFRERGPDGGILSLQIGRLDALEATSVRKRLGRDIGSYTGLVIVELVAFAAVQHLHRVTRCQYTDPHFLNVERDSIRLTRKILSTLLSDSSPANLFPVPSKHSTNCLGTAEGASGAVSMADSIVFCLPADG